MTGIATCCARAASDHVAADPIPVTGSRRRTARAIFGSQLTPSKQRFATSDMGRNGQFALQKL